MEVETLSQSFHDSKYLEARRLTREEIAAAYHVSPLLIGILERSSYSNIAGFSQGAVHVPPYSGGVSG
jgi:phage portal protein BeeE